MADVGLVAFSFSLGLAAFFSPCGIPMLPAYLSYYLTREGDAAPPFARAIGRGVGGGLVAAAGAFAVLASIGLLAIALGAPFKERVLWLELVGGLVVIAMGILVLLGRGPSVTLALRPSTKRGALGLASFGALYAAVASSCVAPLFIGVVFAAQASATLAEGALVVLAYAAGFATLLVAATTLISTARHKVVAALKSLVPRVERASGVVLILVGIYLVWYWWRATMT